jgi:hypothetical protein
MQPSDFGGKNEAEERMTRRHATERMHVPSASETAAAANYRSQQMIKLHLHASHPTQQGRGFQRAPEHILTTTKM